MHVGAGGTVAGQGPATQVGGFVFGLREPQLSTRQVRPKETGISTITGELMGKTEVFPHFLPVRSGPPP